MTGQCDGVSVYLGRFSGIIDFQETLLEPTWNFVFDATNKLGYRGIRCGGVVMLNSTALPGRATDAFWGLLRDH